MFGMGMSEMLVICGVALLVFGPNELPQIAKKIARGMREVRRASDDLRRSIDLDDDDVKPAPMVPPPAITGSRLSADHGDDVGAADDQGFGGYGGNDGGAGDDNVLASDAPTIVAAGEVAVGAADNADDRATDDDGAADAVGPVAAAEPPRG